MKKYILKNNQSPWLEDIYLKELGYKENGFFVEIGVGHSFFKSGIFIIRLVSCVEAILDH